jgi:hypothetical protein
MVKNKSYLFILFLIISILLLNKSNSQSIKNNFLQVDTLPFKIIESDYVPNEKELMQFEEFPNSTTVLADDSKFLWIETNRGLTKFNKLTEEKIYIDGKIDSVNSIVPASLLKDKNENLWFWVEPAKGLAKFDGKSFRFYKLPIDLSEPGVMQKDKNWVYRIERGDTKFDSAGNIWINIKGQRFDKFLKFDGTDWTDFNEENPGLKEKRIFDIIIKPDKSLYVWIDSGLLKIDGKNFDYINSANFKMPINKFEFWDFGRFFPNKNNEILFLMYFVKFSGDTTIGEMTIVNPLQKKIYDSGGEISFDKFQEGYDFEGAYGESAIDKNGNLWISVYPRRDFPYMAGIYKFDCVNLIKYDNPITSSIVIDNDNIIWLG